MNLMIFLRRRLFHMVPVIVGITLVTFFMIHLIPGDPARIMLGPRATPDRVEQLRRELGLDKPLYTQYLYFLGNVVRGDLGRSLYYRQSVTPLVLERLPVTLSLVLYSAALAMLISVPLGVVAALRRNSIIDQAIRTVFLLTLSMPPFWLGLLLIIALGLGLRLFPVSGFGAGPPDNLWHLFLPSLTIALSLSPMLIRSLRISMISNLRALYVTTARSKGLKERTIILRHVLRNSLISTITILGVNLGWLIGGTVIIETVFALPGLGYLMVSAIQARDYPVVQAITLIFAVLVILINLTTDLAYAALDPRVTYD